MKPFTFILALITLLVHSCEGQAFNECSKEKSYPSPERNILTKDVRDEFDFTVYPTPIPGWGHGKNVADEKQWLIASHWPTVGVEAKADSEGLAYIKVNLKRPYYVRAFAVSGYGNGSHKPSGSFFLEGSNDGADWKMVAEGQAHQWHAPGTYPFRPEQIVHATYPGRYKQYRLIAKGWTNGYMVIYNWGLFT